MLCPFATSIVQTTIIRHIGEPYLCFLNRNINNTDFWWSSCVGEHELRYPTLGECRKGASSEATPLLLSLLFVLFPLFRLLGSATSSWRESLVTRQLNHFQTYIYGWSQKHCNNPMLRSPPFAHRLWLTRLTLTYHTYLLQTNVVFICRYGPRLPIFRKHAKTEL